MPWPCGVRMRPYGSIIDNHRVTRAIEPSVQALAGKFFCQGRTIMSLISASVTLAILTGAPVALLAAEASPTHEKITFALSAPTEFSGQWERPAAPFVHPADTRNWVKVHVEAIDEKSGHVHGKLDFYVRSICYDLVDEPFDGTFDGRTLHLSVDYKVCPMMKPLDLRLWQEADGYHAAANWWPLTIKRIGEDSAD